MLVLKVAVTCCRIYTEARSELVLLFRRASLRLWFFDVLVFAVVVISLSCYHRLRSYKVELRASKLSHLFLCFHKDVGFTDEDVEAYKYALSQNGLSGPLNYYRNALLSSDRPRGLFNTKIKAPTLVVWVSI